MRVNLLRSSSDEMVSLEGDERERHLHSGANRVTCRLLLGQCHWQRGRAQQGADQRSGGEDLHVISRLVKLLFSSDSDCLNVLLIDNIDWLFDCLT